MVVRDLYGCGALDAVEAGIADVPDRDDLSSMTAAVSTQAMPFQSSALRCFYIIIAS